MSGQPLSSLVQLTAMSVLMTFVKESYGPTSLGVSSSAFCFLSISSYRVLDPVTSVVPTQDGQTLLVTSLDSHIRLMDMSTGKMLNDFTGHTNDSYRCRACFGHAEASVVCGDEKGMIWAWDLLDVGSYLSPLPSMVSDYIE